MRGFPWTGVVWVTRGDSGGGRVRVVYCRDLRQRHSEGRNVVLLRVEESRRWKTGEEGVSGVRNIVRFETRVLQTSRVYLCTLCLYKSAK